MIKKRVLLLLLLSTSLTGCSLRSNPRAELLTSQSLFSTTVETLVSLRNQDMISDDKIELITSAVRMGDYYLTEWAKQVDSGKPNKDLIIAFEVIMNQLLGAVENNEHSTDNNTN